jgi:hypothetical protein
MVAEGVDHTRIAPAWAVWPVASFLLSNHFDEPSAPPKPKGHSGDLLTEYCTAKRFSARFCSEEPGVDGNGLPRSLSALSRRLWRRARQGPRRLLANRPARRAPGYL